MKILFDTSVLVAALEASHARHEGSFQWLERAKGKEFDFLVAAHTLAECFSVLSSLPVRPRLSPQQALQLLEANVLGHARVVTLSAADYTSLLRGLADLGISGGSVYDGLLAQAARIEEVDLLLTLNPAHFHRVWPEGEAKIRTP